MVDLPDLSESASEAESTVRNLIPWLPDPYVCDACGAYCLATQAYDSRTGAFHNQGYRPVWECPDCGSEYSRLRQHWAMSDCGPDDGAKKTYTCDLDGCEETFENYPTRIEARGRENFYCCKKHQAKGQKNGKVVKCSWCGEHFYKPGCQLDSMGDYSIDNHFCDKECESQYKRVNWVRAGHPNWEGGNSGINAVRHLLSDVSWQETAREARKSDGYVCRMCGEFANGRALDVHHIVPVSTGGTNEEWNLITLCQSCHRKAERYIEKFTEPHLYRLARKFAE